MAEKVVSFPEHFHQGKEDVSVELLDFLSDWLTNHIKKTDMAYSSFLRSKGVRKAGSIFRPQRCGYGLWDQRVRRSFSCSGNSVATPVKSSRQTVQFRQSPEQPPISL